MFKKEHIDALFGELRREWRAKADYEQLVRDAHLGIALSDAGREIREEVDPRVVELIEKHRPRSS